MRIIARMNIGGPAVQVSGLMRGFDSSQFDQRLYTGFCSIGEADYLDTVAHDIEAIRISGLGRRVNLVGDIKAFFKIVNEIRSFKPHVIHTHTAKAGFLGRVASFVSLHPSIRVHTFHGHLLNGYFGPFTKTLIVLTEKLLAMFTHQLLAVGEKVRQDLLDAGVGHPGKFGVMPPGLSLGKFPPKIKAQETLGISTTKLQCGFIGRVTQIKRPDRFLDVVNAVNARGVEVEFFMAGDGELLEMCRDRILSENLTVKVLGWQNEIEKVLSCADLVVLTSDNEGTPLSLIQAGMAGLPVVATNVGSVPEIVLDGKTGFVTGLEVNEIADAIQRLSQEPELRLKMGRFAQEFTTTRFGVQRLILDHENLYKHLLLNLARS